VVVSTIRCGHLRWGPMVLSPSVSWLVGFELPSGAHVLAAVVDGPPDFGAVFVGAIGVRAVDEVVLADRLGCGDVAVSCMASEGAVGPVEISEPPTWVATAHQPSTSSRVTSPDWATTGCSGADRCRIVGGGGGSSSRRSDPTTSRVRRRSSSVRARWARRAASRAASSVASMTPSTWGSGMSSCRRRRMSCAW
jgi:hypothetical protein